MRLLTRQKATVELAYIYYGPRKSYVIMHGTKMVVLVLLTAKAVRKC